MTRGGRRSPRGVLWWVTFLFMSAVTAIFLQTFLLAATAVTSAAMTPTLLPGDRVLVNRLAYALSDPRRGDVVLFLDPQGSGAEHIGRVLAFPGEMVEVRENRVWINGAAVREPYLQAQAAVVATGARQSLSASRVPRGQLFLMVDNRTRASGGPPWSFVGERRLVGRVVLVYWSWRKMPSDVRWSRIGRLV